MSITFAIIGGLLLLFLVYIFYNYRRIKNLPHVAASEKIKILTAQNFTTQVKKGTVLVDFWAPWCAPCKMIAPLLNEIAEEESERITIGKLNVDEQPALAQKFGIRGIPTLILFKNGREEKRITGVKPKRALLQEIGLG